MSADTSIEDGLRAVPTTYRRSTTPRPVRGHCDASVRGWLTDNTDSQEGKVISEHPRSEDPQRSALGGLWSPRSRSPT